MKVLILSDIHSNIYALDAIWAQEKDSDLILCTGDLVDYGPYPKEVLNWVQEHQVHTTVGNHDRWVVEVFKSGKPLDLMPIEKRTWADHNANLLSSEDIFFLDSLPDALTIKLDGIDYGMTHLFQDYDEITNLYAFEQFQRQSFRDHQYENFPRLILGHTHRQGIHYLSDEVLWCNPGSVSYRRPDDPDQTAHYITIIDGRISLRRLPYNLKPLRQMIRMIALNPSETHAAERFFGERFPKP